MATYEKILNDTCKIDFKWFLSKYTEELKWRDLTGPEKLRLFSHIDELDLNNKLNSILGFCVFVNQVNPMALIWKLFTNGKRESCCKS